MRTDFKVRRNNFKLKFWVVTVDMIYKVKVTLQKF